MTKKTEELKNEFECLKHEKAITLLIQKKMLLTDGMIKILGDLEKKNPKAAEEVKPLIGMVAEYVFLSVIKTLKNDK